ncbi:MAG: RNA methyltransferase [Bacilli bacterium]|nr:RNA methyltransferase [Bacilli bacterium]
MLITSLENNNIKKYLKLKQKKYRDEEKMFLIEGEHLVREAYKSNRLYDLLVLDGYDFKIDFSYTNASLNIMKKLSDMDSTPKVIGIVKIEDKKTNLGNRIIILDGIQDPGNLGTIIRSSVAFNITDIILSDTSVDLYNDKVIRASQGMIFKINIERRNLVEVINKLKKQDYVILGTNVKEGIDVRDINVKKYAIVLGNEGQGVSFEVANLCDKNIYIKMNKEVESLNVGVATSIIIYELNGGLK